MRVHKIYQSEFNPHFPPTVRRETRERTLIQWARKYHPTAKDFGISLQTAFSRSAKTVPSVDLDRGFLGGTPRVKGTRIPLYMVLDAIEYYGNLQGALKSYPQLSLEQVKDAMRFAKLVLEWPVDLEATHSD